MVCLPIAFLSLVHSGTVGPALFDVINVFPALFPFDAALRRDVGRARRLGPRPRIAILHLAILAAAYGVLARFALRRFA